MLIQSDLSNTLSVKKCTVLGGAGYIFDAGDTVDLVFHSDKLMIQADESMLIRGGERGGFFSSGHLSAKQLEFLSQYQIGLS